MALTAQQQTLVDAAKKGGVVTTAQMTAAGFTPNTFNQAMSGSSTTKAVTPVAPTTTNPVTAANAAYSTFLKNQTQANLDAWAAAAKAAGQDVTANVANYQAALTKAAQTQTQQAAQLAAQQKAAADAAAAQQAAQLAAQQAAQQAAAQQQAAQAKAEADKIAQAQALAAQQAAAQQAQAQALAQQEAEKQAQAAALAEQQRAAQQQQAAAQASADAKQAADLKAQQDAQAAAAADFAAKQGAIDAANNARIQAATDKTAMLTIAQNAAGVPGGKDLLGNYSSPQEALTNAQSAYTAAQTAYDNYKGSDPAQRAQLAATLNNAAQLNSFLTRDLATNYTQANQNLPAANQQYTQAAQTLQQAQNAVSAQQEQASVAKSIADRAAMDKGPLSGVNWALVGAAALIAVGVYDPELLGLADSGALTEEALVEAGVAPEATAEAITTGIEGGTIPAEAAPEIASTVAEAAPVAPESIATETLTPPVEAGPVAPEVPVSSTVPPGQPITELNAQQTAELMKNIDPNMINSYTSAQEAQYNQLIAEGKTPLEATNIIESGGNAPFRVDVSGTAGFEGNPTVVTGPLSSGSQLATQAQIESGLATYNPAVNAWEVAAPTALSPVVPAIESVAGSVPLSAVTPVAVGGGLTAAQTAALIGGGAAALGGAAGAGGAAVGAPTAAPVTVTTQPVTTTPVEPIVTQPVTTPVTTTPVEPIVTQPVTTTPVTTTPVEPIVTQPVTTQPVTTQPVTPVTTTPVTTTPPPYTGPGIGEIPNPAEVPVVDATPVAPPLKPVVPPPEITPQYPTTVPTEAVNPVNPNAPDNIDVGGGQNFAEVPVTDAVPTPVSGTGMPLTGSGGLSLTDAALLAGGTYLGTKLLTPPTIGGHNYGPMAPPNWSAGIPIAGSGLNPGYLMGRAPATFAGGTPTQANMYWGQHPYVTDLAHITDVDRLPPAQPWGAAYAQGVGPNRLDVDALIRQLLGAPAQAAAVGTAYPGPIAPGK